MSGFATDASRAQLGEDSVGIGEPVGILDTHDAKSASGEVGVTFAVALDRGCMDLAVEFDDERERAAVEIGDERTDRMLRTPLESDALPRAHSLPEGALGGRRVLT